VELDPIHNYAIYLYPEISYAPSDTLSSRSLHHLTDRPQRDHYRGSELNVFQGFFIQAFRHHIRRRGTG
jgi:hypothetical protein